MRQLVWVLVWVALGATGCGPSSWLASIDPGAWWLRWQGDTQKQLRFRQAWQAWRAQDVDRAYALFVRVARAYPELADHSWFHAGLAAAKRQRRQDAIAAMERVVGEYPQSIYFAEAAAHLAEWLEESGSTDRAQLWATRVLAQAPLPEWQQRARLVLARVRERAGDYAEAARVYREVWGQAKNAEVRERARSHLTKLRAAHPQFAPNPGEQVEEAEWAIRDRDWTLARNLAEPLATTMDPELRARALVVLAEVAYGLAQWEDALRGWWMVGTRYPHTRSAASALYRMGTVLWNRNRDVAADRVFAELLQRYPLADVAPRALLARARIAYSGGDLTHARAHLPDHCRLLVGPNLQRQLFWWRGWFAWRRGSAGEARRWFRRRGNEDKRGLYWRARCLEARGQTRQADQIYRKLASGVSSYYAHMAERRLRGLGAATVRLAGLGMPAPTLPEIPPMPSMDPFHGTRWQHLRAAGVQSLARKELAAIAAGAPVGDPTWRAFLLAAWMRTDAYADALRAVWSWHDWSPSDRERVEYPLAFQEHVLEAANAQRIDPLFVLAVMRQESLFDPEVCSPAGACGLMQLMPQTARRVAPAVGLDPERVDLFDPRTNILVGVRHLRELLDLFGDQPFVALAAYNGGEEAARRWLARAHGLAPDEFVEEITYRETRDYVKRVWTHYLRYQQIYRPGTAS